ncbi:hypothetical protein PVAP13_6NG267000 [Panicum virgatum]|uniref:Uncharacterized protein n=1 Tax=Panicum virgatum TaxID=38727 RepID=A0A8T0R350_PANVG|nr:hypothetical protein PVAP13_6NG267000 [Panicum virgatum]
MGIVFSFHVHKRTEPNRDLQRNKQFTYMLIKCVGEMESFKNLNLHNRREVQRKDPLEAHELHPITDVLPPYQMTDVDCGQPSLPTLQKRFKIQNLQHLLAPSTLVAPALPSHGRRLDAIESRPSSRERTGDGWSPTSEQLNRVLASGARAAGAGRESPRSPLNRESEKLALLGF